MSLLEQVAALGDGVVSTEGVTRALGLADGDAFTGLVAAISDQDAPAALGLVAQLAARGADLRRFVADSLGFFRGIFLAQYAPNLEEITDEPPEILNEWRRQGRILSPPDVLRAIDGFSEALLHLRQGREERLVLELALIRLTRPETALNGEALATRIDRLEQEVKQRASASPQRPSDGSAPSEGSGPGEARDEASRASVAHTPRSDAAPAEEDKPAEEDNRGLPDIPPAPEPAPPDTPATEVTLAEFSAAWPVVVARIRSDFGARRHAFVRVAEPQSLVDGVAVLTLPSHQHFHLEQLKADDQLLRALETITAEVLGSTVTLRFRSDGDVEPEQGDEPPRAPDQDQLDDGPSLEDPEDLIADMLGGTVVEE
jgi:DNA polymerase III gamma/tau subunit